MSMRQLPGITETQQTSRGLHEQVSNTDGVNGIAEKSTN